MRYELSDDEWAAMKQMLPNKPRAVPRSCVLNGIFWVLRSGAPWRDLPANFGPYTTCYKSLCSVASGGRVGQANERAGRDARFDCADDRHIYRSRTSAWGLHHTKPTTVDRAVARWTNQQDSRARRYEWAAGSARVDDR